MIRSGQFVVVCVGRLGVSPNTSPPMRSKVLHGNSTPSLNSSYVCSHPRSPSRDRHAHKYERAHRHGDSTGKSMGPQQWKEFVPLLDGFSTLEAFFCLKVPSIKSC